MGAFGDFFRRLFSGLFRKNKTIRLGLYGPPNGGKTTLANRVCKEWLGEEMGRASRVPHETREVQMKERLTLKRDGREMHFCLVDSPGIATRVDYEDFLKSGIKEAEARIRAVEATKGVIDAIRWIDELDCVVVVLDATRDPYTQVNITIIGNLQARHVPLLLVANKMDLKKADLKHVQAAFPMCDVIGLSAKTGEGMEVFYEKLFDLRRQVKRPKGDRPIVR